MQNAQNFKPRVPPYNTMMQLHLQSQPSRELVLHYYNQMIQAGVLPSAHTYKLLLDAYGTLLPVDLAAVHKVFDNLCNDRAVKVQGTHWASLIHAFGGVSGNVEEAVKTFESISTHPTTPPGARIEPVCWESLFNVFAMHGRLDLLEQYRNRMAEIGVRPTAYCNNMLIKGYAAAGQIDKCREVFDSMSDSLMGVAAPNNHPTLLTSSGQAKPTTTANTDITFREPSTYEAMIRAELACGDRSAARELCDKMEGRIYPLAVTSRIRAILDGPPV